jgi:hypothetical protein
METFTNRETYHTKQNHMIETITSNHNGQINLGDYFIADENEVAKSYVKYIEGLDKVKDFDIETVSRLLRVLQRKTNQSFSFKYSACRWTQSNEVFSISSSGYSRENGEISKCKVFRISKNGLPAFFIFRIHSL